MNKTFLALARKYRPKKLSELIGQEVFVTTITNAVESNRLAHAYLFSGVRGVGKTTTARILAHLFNGEKEAVGNPIDLQEVDAARYTGVNEMRELLDGIKYRPSNWKYKVYIIDEVHMLSNSAVSSLLKNLEEPPEHVKFIFCTTEPRKIPATIISRCQRFDLKRVSFDILANYLQEIVTKEGSKIDLPAANLISRAADGSVRDALSILDKSLSTNEKVINEAFIEKLLGLVDREKVYSLFKCLMNTKTKEGLSIFKSLYNSGADPKIIIQDLLEIVHWISRLCVTPDVANEPGVSEIDKNKGLELSKTLDMSELSKTWQILLEGYQEVQNHEMPNMTAEMVLIRLAYASSQSSVEEIIKNFKKKDLEKDSKETNKTQKEEKEITNNIQNDSLKKNIIKPKGIKTDTVMKIKNISTVLKKNNESETNSTFKKETENVNFSNYKDVVDFFLNKKEILLFNSLFSHVHLVNFQKGKIELNPNDNAPKDLASKVGSLLYEWTGQRWIIMMSQEKGEPTLEEQQERKKEEDLQEIMKESRVKEILNLFPDAKIIKLKNKGDKNEL